MYFLSNIPELKIAPDVIFTIGSVNITNTMLGFFVTSLLLIIIAILIRRSAGIIPSKSQVVVESILSFFYDKLVTAFGSEKDAKRFAPFIVTMFLLFLLANQFAVLPLITQVTAGEASLFKTPTSDFSLPIALGLVAAIISHVLALSIAPIKHLDGFVRISSILKIRKLKDIPNALLEVFLGALDIIGELAKVVSISARLFGNVIAGELMVVIITFIGGVATNFIVPIPFIFLSIFSGLIQAFVFPLLALQYIGGTVRAVKEDQSH